MYPCIDVRKQQDAHCQSIQFRLTYKYISFLSSDQHRQKRRTAFLNHIKQNGIPEQPKGLSYSLQGSYFEMIFPSFCPFQYSCHQRCFFNSSSNSSDSLGLPVHLHHNLCLSLSCLLCSTSLPPPTLLISHLLPSVTFFSTFLPSPTLFLSHLLSSITFLLSYPPGVPSGPLPERDTSIKP